MYPFRNNFDFKTVTSLKHRKLTRTHLAFVLATRAHYTSMGIESCEI